MIITVSIDCGGGGPVVRILRCDEAIQTLSIDEARELLIGLFNFSALRDEAMGQVLRSLYDDVIDALDVAEAPIRAAGRPR